MPTEDGPYPIGVVCGYQETVTLDDAEHRIDT